MSNNKKILITQSNLSQTIATQLENNGYDVKQCNADGGTVVSLLQSYQPNLAILEANMPNGDALSVINSTVANGLSSCYLVTTTLPNEFIRDELAPKQGCFFLQSAGVSEIVDKSKHILEANDITFNSRNIKKVVNATRQNNLEEIVSSVLHNIGIPAHVKGYRYIRHSIILSIEDSEMINSVTKILYPAVAKHFQTTPSRVERAIRHAIELAWNRGDVETLTSYFGYTIDTSRGKPTNSEFIAMLSDKLRMKFHG